MSAVKAQGRLKQSIGWSNDRDVMCYSSLVTQRLRQRPSDPVRQGTLS